MKYLCYIFIFGCFIIFSCSKSKEKFVINGNFSGESVEHVILYQQTADGRVQFDSTGTDDKNNFSVKGRIQSPSYFLLKSDHNEYINLIIYPGDHINLEINGDDFEEDYYVRGSDDSKLLQEVIIAQNRLLEQITEISYKYEESKLNPDSFFIKKAGIDKIYDSIVNRYKEYTIRTIKENPRSFVNIWSLYQNIGPRTSLFDKYEDYKIYNFVDSNLSVLFPRSEAVRLLNEEVVELNEILKYRKLEEERVKIGKPAPNIILQDTSGVLIDLSSLKGEYVLLTFWASWNTKSCELNKKYAGLYEKYKKKNFEIYQVSLDMSRESWISAIKRDELTWINVSDLKYWNSAVIPIYQVYQVPANYLLDKEGIVMSKNIELYELESKLEELLK